MIDRQYDVVVVGGGIIGLATSMKLTQDFPNLKVAVLEKEFDTLVEVINKLQENSNK